MTATDYPKYHFSDDHRPSLPPGTYRVTAEHSTTGVDHEQLLFSVDGPRFSLPPGQVAAVFPPKGSSGSYSGVLAHVGLANTILPWLRSPQVEGAGDDPEPVDGLQNPAELPPVPSWLAVLVFSDQEWADHVSLLGAPADDADDEAASAAGAMTVREYLTSVFDEADFGDQATARADDGIEVIDVDPDFLTAICPTLQELSLTAHLRVTDRGPQADAPTDDDQSTAAAENGGAPADPDELAFVLSTRVVPPADVETGFHACLVSVEDRWAADAAGAAEIGGDPARLVDGKARLLVLHRWQFRARAEAPELPDVVDIALPKGAGSPSSNGTVLGDPAMRRADDPSLPASARSRLHAGFVPVQHHLRDGSWSAAWVRGPLVPFDIELPTMERAPEVRHADELLSFDEEFAMFDLTYASAWELGRSSALADREFSIRLHRWKRRHRHDLHRQTQLIDHDLHALPLHHHHDRDANFDDEREWLLNDSVLASINRLERIPWRNLIPDPELLPDNRRDVSLNQPHGGSIRVFRVDPFWLECARDGAFSVGRVTADDAARDDQLHAAHGSVPATASFGLLMNVPDIVNWPDLRVCAWWPLHRDEGSNEKAAFDTSTHLELRPLRLVRPAPGRLLALFSVDLADANERGWDASARIASAFDLYTPKETLHSGLDHDADAGSWTVERRDPTTGEPAGHHVVAPGVMNDAHRVDFAALAEDLGGDLTSHGLALSLIDAPERVRIVLPTPSLERIGS